MDYVQLGFYWFLFVACLIGWVATTGKSGTRLGFWFILAFGWACFGTIEILVVSETLVDGWILSTLRIGGLSLIAIAIIAAIWSMSEERFM